MAGMASLTYSLGSYMPFSPEGRVTYSQSIFTILLLFSSVSLCFRSLDVHE